MGRKGCVTVAVAKHIRIAREQGPEAGLEAYLATPSARLHPAFRAISKKRTPQTKLDAYCAQFADLLGDAPMRTPVQKDKQVDAIQGLMEQMQALQAQIESIAEADDDEDEYSDEILALAKATGAEPAEIAAKLDGLGVVAQKRPSAQVDEGVITKGEAWDILSEELGGDASLKGRNWDDSAPATNGQLYRLNTLGFLRLEVEA